MGAGTIGLEIAQAMQRLGSQVTVVTGSSGRVMGKEERCPAGYSMLPYPHRSAQGIPELNDKEPERQSSLAFYLMPGILQTPELILNFPSTMVLPTDCWIAPSAHIV